MSTARFDKDLISKTGKRLRKVRKARKYSQEEVQESIRIDVGRYERGEANISLTTLGILCRHYEITLEEFFKGISLK